MTRTEQQQRLHVKAYFIDAAGRIVGTPVHTVHPLSGAAVIEERTSQDGLRMVYEITTGGATCNGI